MKVFASFLLLSIFIMIGCQDDSSILEPTNNPVEYFSKYNDLEYIQSNRTNRIRQNDFSGTYTSHFLGGEEIVNLDSFKEKFTLNYTVNGEKGGILFLRIWWINEDSLRVVMESKLTIPKGAFKGDLTFDMIFDLENYALELYPSPYTFDIPVKLDLKFTNIDLININSNTTDFTYLDGTEKMEYKNIKIDDSTGSLAVYGALLHHFSRYGWTRKK